MKRLGIGLIGTGFMGRAHALAFRTVGGVFDLPATVTLEIVADATRSGADAAARTLGFERATDDWRSLVTDPAVDIVAVTTPNALHKEMALAAIAAGKAVYCEKPLSVGLADAAQLVAAAQECGSVTMVGFNYLCNPMISLAREIIDSGEIGEITGFRGIHAEGFMADPAMPFNWRCEPGQAGGALADIGSHIISMACHLAGDIEAVCGEQVTVHRQRPLPDGGGSKAVTVDDRTLFLARFASGATGTLEASWIATGRQMQLAFELYGTRGSLDFSQERFNELRLYTAGAVPGRDGYKTITAGPEHAEYGRFCPAPGHQLGFNDLKVIEVKRLIEAVCGLTQAYPDFGAAFAVEQVVAAVRRSCSSGGWVRVADVE